MYFISLFSFSIIFFSEVHGSHVSENYVQVITDATKNCEQVYKKLLGDTQDDQQVADIQDPDDVYASITPVELVLLNSYHCHVISQFIPQESIEEELECCADAIKRNNYFDFRDSVEKIKIFAARFSSHEEIPNYIKDYKSEDQKNNFLHILCNQIVPAHVDKTSYNYIQSLIIQDLCELGVDIHGGNEFNSTPMHYAARSDNVHAIMELYNRGADVNAEHGCSCTPMQGAILCASYDAAKVLYDCRADVNKLDAQGWTVLHYAACIGKIDRVTMLLQLNADISIVTPEGKTAEQLATKPEVKALLKRHRLLQAARSISCSIS